MNMFGKYDGGEAMVTRQILVDAIQHTGEDMPSMTLPETMLVPSMPLPVSRQHTRISGTKATDKAKNMSDTRVCIYVSKETKDIEDSLFGKQESNALTAILDMDRQRQDSAGPTRSVDEIDDNLYRKHDSNAPMVILDMSIGKQKTDSVVHSRSVDEIVQKLISEGLKCVPAHCNRACEQSDAVTHERSTLIQQWISKHIKIKRRCSDDTGDFEMISQIDLRRKIILKRMADDNNGDEGHEHDTDVNVKWNQTQEKDVSDSHTQQRAVKRRAGEVDRNYNEGYENDTDVKEKGNEIQEEDSSDSHTKQRAVKRRAGEVDRNCNEGYENDTDVNGTRNQTQENGSSDSPRAVKRRANDVDNVKGGDCDVGHGLSKVTPAQDAGQCEDMRRISTLRCFRQCSVEQ